MKKNIFWITMLLCGGLVLTTSCTTDEGEPQFENDEFSSVLYLRDYGLTEVDFYNVGLDVTFETSVGKGGTDPSVIRTASLDVFTQEEMDAYNTENGTHYVIMPSDCYSFTQQYAFDKHTEGIPTTITLKSQVGELDEDTPYVLPLRLTSTDGEVNDDRQTLILMPEVTTPVVALGATGLQTAIDLSPSRPGFSTTMFNTTVTLDALNDDWDFSVVLETDEAVLQGLVNEVATEENMDYQLLPSSAYTMPEINFTPGEDSKDLQISIDVTGMEYGDYLLPIVMKDVTGMPFDVDVTPCYVWLHVADGVMKMNLEGRITTNSEGISAWANLPVTRLIDSNFYCAAANDGYSSDKNPGYWQSEWTFNDGGGDVESEHFDTTYGVYIDLDIAGLELMEEVQLKMWNSRGNYPADIKIYTQESGSNTWTECVSTTATFETTSISGYIDGVWTSSISLYAYETELIPITANTTKVRFSILTDARGRAYNTGVHTGEVSLDELELWGR